MNFAKTIAILMATSATAFLAGSYWGFIPIGRGMVGGGFYEFVNEYVFYELGVFTALAVYLVSRRYLNHKRGVALSSGIGIALFNVAILIVDVRSAKYHESIEQIIASNYGSTSQIMVKAAILGLAGILLFAFSMWAVRGNQRGSS